MAASTASLPAKSGTSNRLMSTLSSSSLRQKDLSRSVAHNSGDGAPICGEKVAQVVCVDVLRVREPLNQLGQRGTFNDWRRTAHLKSASECAASQQARALTALLSKRMLSSLSASANSYPDLIDLSSAGSTCFSYSSSLSSSRASTYLWTNQNDLAVMPYYLEMSGHRMSYA